jgi:hypothetical protein
LATSINWFGWQEKIWSQQSLRFLNFHGCLEYLVHWYGYNVSKHMWKPTFNLANAR